MPFLDPVAIIAILVALSVHEWAHAYAASRLGDPTAHNEGRLTVNPIAHLDPMGTILFLLVGFGWGKPVPVNPAYFHHPKRDTAIVAAAGPLSNLVLATLSFAILMFVMQIPVNSAEDLFTSPQGTDVLLVFFARLCEYSLFTNLALMAFNLLPVAPLDGSKILQMFVPLRYEYDYERFMGQGPLILLALIIAERLVDFPLLSVWVHGIINGVLAAFDAVAGVIL